MTGNFDDSTLKKVMNKRQKGTCRHKDGCSNAAVPGNYNFCADHRTPKQDARQGRASTSRTSIARALLGSSSNATTHATSRTTTNGAASHVDNNENNEITDNDDETTLTDDDIPDIIILNSRGEPDEPATPENDPASVLLNSSGVVAAQGVFGAMSGTVVSPNPTPEQQAVLNGRALLCGVTQQLPDY